MILSRQVTMATILAFLTALVSTASGHYLWVSVDGKSGGQGTVNVYFEEGPAPGDGGYLDPFVKNGKTWIRTVTNPKPESIEMKDTRKDKLRWLTAPAPTDTPRSVDSYGKFGVYRYGTTDVLLHYYARNVQVDSHDDLHELSRANHLDLDIVPHDREDGMELTILWKGKPAENRIVHVRGPNKFQENPKTDAKGKVRFAIKDPGGYLFRTNVEESIAGKEDDREYSLIRHHATMQIVLPLKK